MTIFDEPRFISYTADGATQGPFSIPFQFFEVEAYINGILIDPSEYEITQDDPDETGEFNFAFEATGVYPSGTLTIVGVTEIKQQTEYQENARFPAASHERALDRLTMMAQELHLRSAKRSNIDAAVNGAAELPTP